MSESPLKYALPARMASVVLHPVFIPALLMAFLVYVYPPIHNTLAVREQNLWLIMVAYTSILFPIVTVVLLWRLKFVESIQLKGQKERYGPLMASMLFYFWMFWVFHKQFSAPLEIQGLLFAVFLSNVLVFMATIFYKISMHTAGWATAVVLLAYWTMKNTTAFPLLLLAVVLAGMVGSIRFYLQAHSSKQIYVGYVVGAIAALLAILIVPLIP